MTRDEMINAAVKQIESKPGYNYRREAVEQIIDAGLVAGEVIKVGGDQRIVVIDQSRVSFEKLKDGNWQTLQLRPGAEQEAAHRALVVKAVEHSHIGTESHSLASLGRCAYPGGYSGKL